MRLIKTFNLQKNYNFCEKTQTVLSFKIFISNGKYTLTLSDNESLLYESAFVSYGRNQNSCNLNRK